MNIDSIRINPVLVFALPRQPSLTIQPSNMSAVKSEPADSATIQEYSIIGEQDDASDRLASWIAELSLDEAHITFVFDGYDEASDDENVDSKDTKSPGPFEIPHSLLRDMRNLNCSASNSDSSDTDDEEAEHVEFIRKLRELRRVRRCTASSIGKRTVSERSESDNEELAPLSHDAVASRAERLRRREANRERLLHLANQTSSTEPIVEERDSDGPSQSENWSATLLEMPFFEACSSDEDGELQDLPSKNCRDVQLGMSYNTVRALRRPFPSRSSFGRGEPADDLKTPATPGEVNRNSQMGEHGETHRFMESRAPGGHDSDTKARSGEHSNGPRAVNVRFDADLDISEIEDNKRPSVPGRNQKRKRLDEPQPHPEPALLPLLACPYLKHDAEKYGQLRGCRGAAFKDIHRLKEHLYRTHRQKENCPRCRTIFDDEEERNRHLKSKTVCEVVEGISLEGYDKAQGEKLKSKKRVKGVNSREDKWKHIYGILFPNCKDTPDPFYKPIFDDESRKSGLIRLDLEDTEHILPQDVPLQLEEDTYALAEKAIGMELSLAKRRKLMDVFKGFAVKMSQLSQKEGPEARADKETTHDSSEERIIDEPEGSGLTPGSSELSQSLHTPDAAEPLAMFALSSMPEAVPSDVAPKDTLNVAPPPTEPRISPLELENFSMGEEFEFGDWSRWPLDNRISYDWINGGNYGFMFSFEGHTDSLQVQNFGNCGGQPDIVTTEAFLAANEYPLAGTNQAWAAADERWLGM
ncbi:hypothetical protein CkaCkLH20_03163 [Colletotrichum karsti]|uniref:C2H2-type domain-containing protein n=1 Tax=Colletotrichum karsti TaxID=1095194 RepID=A0A9P6IBL1_9PEZI|nr:uncharacterized protein CkaCkLH20_03163 [Colletotrichum karsti]KAF9879620.1 hypothetical protein CkaCkLH20_03163 [Colletotrichum karsti]